MNELLPYEEQLQQQWTDIPLPDEDAAWEDMARRLKEDDDDKGIVFWWRPGCGLLGLLLVVFALGWWIIRPDSNRRNNNTDSTQAPMKLDQENKIEKTNLQKLLVQPHPEGTRIKKEKKPFRTKAAAVQHGSTAKANNRKHPGIESTTRNSPSELPDTELSDTTGISSTTVRPSSDKDPDDLPDTVNITATADSVTEKITQKPVSKDSVKKANSALQTAKKPEPPDSTKNNKVFFSTGIALLQQLPLDGKKITPYSSTGRKASLADYIPAVYARLNKKDKWFLQAEFRYGAPQYTKEFLYKQTSIRDTGTNPRFETTNSSRLKKTFYHQLPLTFNYYVLPNWSMGGGVVWNKFFAAVTDQESIKHDNFTQVDSILSKGIVTVKEDTSGTFASSYFQAVLETQYQWRRFSIGTRYAFGLQPYIKFTLPGEAPGEEKNSSLQVFIRFELWRPKQKK